MKRIPLSALGALLVVVLLLATACAGSAGDAAGPPSDAPAGIPDADAAAGFDLPAATDTGAASDTSAVTDTAPGPDTAAAPDTDTDTNTSTATDSGTATDNDTDTDTDTGTATDNDTDTGTATDTDTADVDDVPDLTPIPDVPEVRDVPAEPDVPRPFDADAAADVPAVPQDVPESFDVPPIPDVPDVPDVPDGATETDVLPTPDVPAEPDVTEVPDVPAEPDVPLAPDVPAEPDVPPAEDVGEPPPESVCGDGEITGDEVCDDGVNDYIGGGCLPGCMEEDLTDEVFDRDILAVDIVIAPEDWEALRVQRKTRHSIFVGADCRERQIVNPYTWFPGDVTIDGVTVPVTGLRKKGHLGSQSTIKPSLKLRFDKYVDDQRYHTMKRMALNNGRNDPTYMRTCLAYATFAAAGVPAPRCSYAHVTVNGRYLGVYFAVEEVKKPYLRRHLPDDEGNLYEGTACDFRPEFFGGFEQETNEHSDPYRTDLQAVYDAVWGTTDEEFEAVLGTLFNLERLYRFWAVESLIWHRDGYSGNANNYFLYADPADGGRFLFLPWGPDAAFRADNRAAVPDSVLAFGAITNRLYLYGPTRDRFYDALFTLLDEVWDADALVAEVARVEAVLTPWLPEGELAGFPGQVSSLASVIEQRRDVIEAVVADGYPEWTSGMRSLPCRVPVAPVFGTVSTTWDTLGDNIWASGTGSIEMYLEGVRIVATRVGARAGTLSNGRGRVQMFVETDDGRRLDFTFTFPDERFFDPFMTLGDHDLISPPLNTSVIERDISGGSTTVLERYDVGEGTWTFEAVDDTPGAPIEVSFEGMIYRGVP